MPKLWPNIRFPHQQDFFPIRSVTKSSTSRFSHENLVEKFKIFGQDFVPIRTALMGTKSCTKILNFSTRFSSVEDFVTLFMGRPLSILLFFIFFSCFFFYESQALHRQLCTGICYFLVTLLVLHIGYFLVFLHPIVLFFFVFFFLIFNFELCACLLFAVCCLLFAIHGWIFAAVMLYSSVMHY